ncbi:hypothetical protein DRQ25_13465 [Candidatus Fermentibacteria bacterium]|nr:MAG: hypothetical protein DRQ25_13465 [Candidatus Fermentibacteria bacterium]
MPLPVRQATKPAPAAEPAKTTHRKITNVGDKAGCYTLCHPDGTLFPRNATIEHRDDGWVKAQVERGIMAYV